MVEVKNLVKRYGDKLAVATSVLPWTAVKF